MFTPNKSDKEISVPEEYLESFARRWELAHKQHNRKVNGATCKGAFQILQDSINFVPWGLIKLTRRDGQQIDLLYLKYNHLSQEP